MSLKSKEHLMFLGQVLERDGVEYGSNNLIVSPTGSGKTYHMLNILRKIYTGKTLMLVSTSSLKTALGEHEDTYTTQDVLRSRLGIEDDVYLMSYSEFGYKMMWNNKFIADFDLILCDEIHSLFEYYSYNKAHNLGTAIKELFVKYDDKAIFYYTATTSRLDEFIDSMYEDLYENVRIFDYSDDKDIMRYENVDIQTITSINELYVRLSGLEEMKKYKKHKGFIYTERISRMKKIKENLEGMGFSAIEVWSVNNDSYKMNSEQLRARSILLKENRIPDEYDFIIINGSMREGWELKDDRVKIGILDTLDKTGQVQARGRFRGDLSLLIVKAEGDVTPIDVMVLNRERDSSIIERVLGEELDNMDREALVEEFGIRDLERNRLIKWPTIAKSLRDNGYKIEDKRVRKDGKHLRVQIITRVEQEVKPSTDSKAKLFLRKLGETKFAEINKELLSKYINKDSRIAYSHIKTSYGNYVGSEDWNERKFTDVTYLLARESKLFSKKSYSDYGMRYDDIDEVEILTERAKYEKSAVSKLVEAKERALSREREEEDELLKYIAENGGV